MRDPWSGTVLGIFYDTHPHWVVDYGCYAVTLRCKGSLPRSIQLKLSEIGHALKAIDPKNPSAERMRRRHFAILEQALDGTTDDCPFSEDHSAQAMADFLVEYDLEGLRFPHWVVMPNHLHLITAPIEVASAEEFKRHWNRFKALSAKHINQSRNTSGSFWQTSWYDRWIRHKSEHERWQQYLLNNPMKAGLRNWHYKK